MSAIHLLLSTFETAWKKILESRGAGIPPLLFCLLILLALTIPNLPYASAQVPDRYWFEVRSIQASELGASSISGLAYLPFSDRIVVLAGGPGGPNSDVISFERQSGQSDKAGFDAAVSDPLNFAYSATDQSFFFMESSKQELAQVQAVSIEDVQQSLQDVLQHPIEALGIRDPRGMSFDSTNGSLYVLDAAGPAMIRISPDPATGFDIDFAAEEGQVESLALESLSDRDLRGLAYNPGADMLYTYSVGDGKFYAITPEGAIDSTLDTTSLEIENLDGLAFAPSSDGTDDPSQMNLFLVDSGSDARLIELSLTKPQVQAVEALSSTSLVQVIDASIWSPPSPDSTGIEYLLGEDLLMVSDSEVEELPGLYAGANVFVATNTGALQNTCDTTSFSTEPSGAAANPANGHRFFADDNSRRVFEVDPGLDTVYCTPDDSVTSISTLDFNSGDPEGVAFGAGRLFVADGVGMEVYVISWGANGIFDGPPPAGDDTWTHFDTSAMGLRDPEGVGYHWDRETLFLSSRSDPRLVETTITGGVLRVYDINPLNIFAPSGVAIGPSSVNPSVMSVYVSDRGVDNSIDPDENDGKIYEIDIGPPGPTVTPTSTRPPGVVPTEGPTPTATHPPGVVPTEVPTTSALGLPEAVQTAEPTPTQPPKSASFPNPTPTPENPSLSYPTAIPSAPPRSSDVPAAPWSWKWVEALYASGSSSNCRTAATESCAHRSITRAQMAVFLERKMRGADYAPPAASGVIFADVPSDYWAAAWIEQLYADGIVSACSADPFLYCPEDSLTRVQMAVFLARTFELPMP